MPTVRARGAWIAALTITAILAAACSNSPHRSPSSTSDASTTALGYTRAILSGNPKTSVRYFPPASRVYFARAFREAAKGKVVVSGHSKNLAVGSVSESGRHAVVVLTGTVCPSSFGTAGGSLQPCVTNTNAHSHRPDFLVYLAQIGSQWFVTGNPAAQNQRGNSTSIATTTTPAG